MASSGPRAKLFDEQVRKEIDREFEESELKRQNMFEDSRFSTRFRETFNQPNFTPSLTLNDPSIRVPTKHADYEKDSTITYYSYSVAHENKGGHNSINFPVTSPSFRKSTVFTNDINDPKKTETHQHPLRGLSITDHRNILKFKTMVLNGLSDSEYIYSNDKLPGYLVRAAVELFRSFDNDSDCTENGLPLKVLYEKLESILDITLTPQLKESLKITFDHQCNYHIQINELLLLFLGPSLSPRHEELVVIIYEKIAGSVDNSVNTETIRRKYQSSNNDFITQFLQGLSYYGYGPDEYVISSFLEYYRGVYADLQDDTKFENLLRESWDI